MITIADWKDEKNEVVSACGSHKRKRGEGKRAPKNNNNNNKHSIEDKTKLNVDRSRTSGLDVVKWRPLKFPSSHPRNSDGAIEELVRSGHASYEDEEGRLVLVGGGSGSTLDVSRLEVREDGGVVAANVIKIELDDCKLPERFAFAYAYCRKQKALFMHGGLDTQYNHSATRFLTVAGDVASIRNMSTALDRSGPSPRGYHSAVYIEGEDDDDHIYTFGGQCCVGGPYEFYNDVHRMNLTNLNWESVDCAGQPPSPRSQCYAFKHAGALYVYGGYDGVHVLTDLHRLNLSTHTWEQVATRGHHGPVGLKGMTPLDFHIYFCRPSGLVVGKRLLLLTEDYEQSRAAVFALNLNTMEWTKLTGMSALVESPPFASPTGEPLPLPKTLSFDPPARGCPTLSFIQNKYFLLVGGHPRSRTSSDDADRVWRLDPPSSMSWSQERLLWLASIKNRREDCPLAACPPHIIYKIVGLVNARTYCLK